MVRLSYLLTIGRNHDTAEYAARGRPSQQCINGDEIKQCASRSAVYLFIYLAIIPPLFVSQGIRFFHNVLVLPSWFLFL